VRRTSRRSSNRREVAPRPNPFCRAALFVRDDLAAAGAAVFGRLGWTGNSAEAMSRRSRPCPRGNGGPSSFWVCGARPASSNGQRTRASGFRASAGAPSPRPLDVRLGAAIRHERIEPGKPQPVGQLAAGEEAVVSGLTDLTRRFIHGLIQVMRRSRSRSQLPLPLAPRFGWGGARKGAGRPAGSRPRVQHLLRPPVPGWAPAHVTVRVRPGLPSLRRGAFVQELRASLRRGCERGDFRVLHYSVQADHVHLLVESAGKRALACGMKSIGARLARAIHRADALRGPVLDGRYHLRVLRTPREVRNAIAYVLLNVRHHLVKRGGTPSRHVLDAASSARWFDGWAARATPRPTPAGAPEVARPHTWLARVGWRRHGLIDPGAGLPRLDPPCDSASHRSPASADSSRALERT
jgi:REP element-mobilizing transposase RayT